MERHDQPAEGNPPMRSAKAEIRELLDELPEDCTMEDIQYLLYVRQQIRAGLWSLENEPTFSQEEVERSLSRWLTS